MAFGQKTSEASASKNATTGTSTGSDYQPAEDHYADVTEMVTAEGKKSKFIKFVQDVNDGNMHIPKGTIFTFDTYTDIYERVASPSAKMLKWLDQRAAPFTTNKGATLTGYGIIKKPYKPS